MLQLTGDRWRGVSLRHALLAFVLGSAPHALGCDALSPMVLDEHQEPDGAAAGGAGRSSGGKCSADPAVGSCGEAFLIESADSCWIETHERQPRDINERMELFEGCLVVNTGAGAACVGCTSGFFRCAAEICDWECANSGTEACNTCNGTYCLPAFETCSGIDLNDDGSLG